MGRLNNPQELIEWINREDVTDQMAMEGACKMFGVINIFALSKVEVITAVKRLVQTFVIEHPEWNAPIHLLQTGENFLLRDIYNPDDDE